MPVSGCRRFAVRLLGVGAAAGNVLGMFEAEPLRCQKDFRAFVAAQLGIRP